MNDSSKLLMARLRRAVLGVATDASRFARRGFTATDPARQNRLEQCGVSFLEGYNNALALADPASIAATLNAIPAERQGFTYEGAGMGFALLDIVSPLPRHRFQRFLAGPGASHRYMVHVGAGWALARTSPYLAWRLGPLDPLLRWLMLDGYGFHEGYFHHHRSIAQQRRPWTLRGYALNAFDQGLGRAIWFVSGAMPDRAQTVIQAYPPARHADLWSGLGLATAYAGGASEEDLHALAISAGIYRCHLAQGASFAAKARALASNPAPHTERACQVFCGTSADACAQVCDETLPSNVRPDGGRAYEHWRSAIRERFASPVSESKRCAA